MYVISSFKHNILKYDMSIIYYTLNDYRKVLAVS